MSKQKHKKFLEMSGLCSPSPPASLENIQTQAERTLESLHLGKKKMCLIFFNCYSNLQHLNIETEKNIMLIVLNTVKD